METLLLQVQEGNWLPFLLLLVVMLLIIKGTDILFHYVRKYREKRELGGGSGNHHATE